MWRQVRDMAVVLVIVVTVCLMENSAGATCTHAAGCATSTHPAQAACNRGAGCITATAAAASQCTMPDARPTQSKRLLQSANVEKTIADLVPKFKSADLATLWSNCLPNTIDTTVRRWKDSSSPETADAFIVTGDIEAMWLRDSTNQVLPYLGMVMNSEAADDDDGQDAALVDLLEGVIRRQARSVLIDPYANAFTLLLTDASPHADDQTSYPGFAGTRPNGMHRGVFERKYELDSLANVLLLSARYYDATGRLGVFDQTWLDAVQSILNVMHTQQEEVVGQGQAEYTFQRAAYNPTDTLSHGDTWPNRATGMIRSAFRPSDDATTYPYNIPSNALAVVALRKVATLLKKLDVHALAEDCLALASGVEKAVHEHGVIKHRSGASVFAYEVDGFGNYLFMDDANLPSLLSLPVFGFINASDPLYLTTRQHILSPDTNPYFFRGPAGSGVGGPHNGANYIWPLSIMVEAWTAQDDGEVLARLELLVNSSACTGLMHESFHSDSVFSYTRSWFAWANSFFGDLVLKIARERPHLILK
ncbi:uncharacterized protein LOC135828738 [Sycon ciliatum]|uniref:uncharacterized protein LOC135828738 n=1 Tax=Sycon ciliatum TaxID=27933 RepID=UPI0031F66A4C